MSQSQAFIYFGQKCSDCQTIAKLHKRCINCWFPVCFVPACKSARDKIRVLILRNLVDWKHMRGLQAKEIRYKDLKRIDIQLKEAKKVFVASVIVDKIGHDSDKRLDNVMDQEREIQNLHSNRPKREERRKRIFCR